MIVFLDVIRLDTVTARVRTPSQSPANNYEGIIVMTTTGETARPLPLLGQAVGQAQASLTRLLTGILARTGTSHQVWLGLQRLNALGGRSAREAYEADLSYWLQLDGPAAARLVGAILLYRDAGFTLAEQKALMASGASGSGEWGRLARRKLAELDEQIARAQAAREAIEHGLRCPHEDITQCPNFTAGVTARLAGQPLSRSHRALHGQPPGN